MSQGLHKHFMAWLYCCVAAALLALGGCAGNPAIDPTQQRFDASFKAGAEKLAAGDWQRAGVAFAQAERTAVLLDRRELRVRALFAIGAVAVIGEQDAAALQAYRQALAEADGLGDVHAAGVARAGMADALRRSGDNTAALQAYEIALSPPALRAGSVEHVQARMGRALVRNAQGQVAAASAELQELEALVRSGQSAGQGSALPGVLSSVLANQATLLSASGQTGPAIAKAEEALARDRGAAQPFALAQDLELLARLYRQAGKPAEARANAERALRVVQATGQSRAITRLQQLLDSLP
jgi:tetratricopeptide (TPR) repeat protein